MAEINTYKNDISQLFKENLPWEKLADCNILVTGATGLIGGCLVEALMMNPQRNYNLYASGRNEERGRKRFAQYINDNSFFFIPLDVLNPIECKINFDYIIHAASNASPNFFSQTPVEVIKSNVEGVIHLMEYGLNHNMKRFLFVSSGEIYGEGDGRVFTEDYSGYVNCATPRACYPSSKRTAETLCVSYAKEYGADVVIVRPCHTYGPHFTEQDNRVYAQFIRNVLNGENIILKSTGEQLRSWCYVVDCVSALLFVLLKGKSCEAYNIANEESIISIRRLGEIIASIGGKNLLFDVPDFDEKQGYSLVSKAVFSTIKLEQLGWHPRTPIIDGLRKTVLEMTGS